MAKRVAKSSPAPTKAFTVPQLTDAQVDAALAARPEWARVGDAISRTWAFANFVQAMTFVRAAADLAEADQHHPDILIRYNKVTLTLSTHDAGGISHKDFDLAAKLDALHG
ncbi:MAG: 4a-hydroxytetrahydrobiopterin dehydratase [Phycisphaerales bacterium]|jgi:4a-hydroxytetrahydrobiopterin dehydratase|nr:4a-hydroxytetrahydrobiopterin dehydratase [Phycisphaerales bacterium]